MHDVGTILKQFSTVFFQFWLPVGSAELTVHVIPHSHCDPGYRETFDEYYKNEVRSIITTVVQALQVLHPQTLSFNRLSQSGWIRKMLRGVSSGRKCPSFLCGGVNRIRQCKMQWKHSWCGGNWNSLVCVKHAVVLCPWWASYLLVAWTFMLFCGSAGWWGGLLVVHVVTCSKCRHTYT